MCIYIYVCIYRYTKSCELPEGALLALPGQGHGA